MNTNDLAKQAKDNLAAVAIAKPNVIAASVVVATSAGQVEVKAERGNSASYSKDERISFKLNGRVISCAKLEALLK